MSDDKAKKTKIDLKARLGKTQLGVGQAAAPIPFTPTPMPTSGFPAAPRDPIAGLPAVATPTAGAQPPSLAPQPAASLPTMAAMPHSPFNVPARQQAPAPAPRPVAAQQTIKVDVGEEIEQERSRFKKRAAIYAVMAGAAGALIGFVAGGSKETGDRHGQAVIGAGALEKDVKAANEKMVELNAKLTEASTALSNKQFPEALPGALAGINVDFDSTKLEGRQVGSMNAHLQRSLFAYASAVGELNKTKDSLRNLLGQAQAPVQKIWAEEKAPVANFSVVFRNDGKDKTVAELVPNKEPFSWKGDFPPSYSVTRLEGGKPAEKKATRWTKGDLAGNDLVAIPIDPKSSAGLTSDILIGRLTKALYDVRRELEGNHDDPSHETGGLLKDGDDLVQELKKYSAH